MLRLPSKIRRRGHVCRHIVARPPRPWPCHSPTVWCVLCTRALPSRWNWGGNHSKNLMPKLGRLLKSPILKTTFRRLLDDSFVQYLSTLVDFGTPFCKFAAYIFEVCAILHLSMVALSLKPLILVAHFKFSMLQHLDSSKFCRWDCACCLGILSVSEQRWIQWFNFCTLAADTCRHALAM